MAFLKVIVLVVATLAFTLGLPQYESPVAPPSNSYGGGGDDGGGAPASYSFSYENSDADSGNYYGHAEKREGDNSAGEYRVLLPDGRTQIVTYTVDGEGGFIANLSYEQPSGNQGGGGGGGYGNNNVNTGGGGGGGYQ